MQDEHGYLILEDISRVETVIEEPIQVDILDFPEEIRGVVIVVRSISSNRSGVLFTQQQYEAAFEALEAN